MPSPVGHALAGLAIGWLVEGHRGLLSRTGVLTAAAYGIVAATPDLDLLLGSHRGPMHGVGFAAIAWLAAWVLTRRARTAAAFGLAYGSHVLLDWLGTDTTPPIGLMALWPFSREYYESPFHIFMAVSRRYWLPGFWTYNSRVVVREVLILAPVVVAVGLLRRRLCRMGALVVACVLLHGAMSAGAFAQTPPPMPYAEALALRVPDGGVVALRGTARGDAHAGASMSARRGAATAAVTLALGVAWPQANVTTQKLPSYVEIVAQYRDADFDAAVKALSSLRTSRLEDERRMLESTPFGSLSPEAVPAAIMVHTEAHFASVSGRNAHVPSPHLDAARRLARRCLELLSTPPSSGDDPPAYRVRLVAAQFSAREFVRQWYLLVVAQFQGMRHISRSAHYLQEARFLFPDDPDVLLASGSHHELLTFIGHQRVPVFDFDGTWLRNELIDPKQEWLDASRCLRSALAANPGLDEAGLRLGRALHKLGDLEGAASELERVRARTGDATMKYLAALFLAAVEEDIGRPKRAGDSYVDAIKTYPPGQSAFVGLSELLYLDSQPASAAKIITNLLEKPAPHDPWWVYVMGQWWHYDARLTAMRNRVRQ